MVRSDLMLYGGEASEQVGSHSYGRARLWGGQCSGVKICWTRISRKRRVFKTTKQFSPNFCNYWAVV